jgi:hypothetical protein
MITQQPQREASSLNHAAHRSEMGVFAQQIAVVTILVTHRFSVLRVRLLAADYDDVT